MAEDILFLKSTAIKKNMLLTINSETRNTRMYPATEAYMIAFDEPWKFVFSIDLLHATLPKSQYLVDRHNATASLQCRLLGEETDTWHVVDLTIGDYPTGRSLATMISACMPGSLRCVYDDVLDNFRFIHDAEDFEVYITNPDIGRMLGFAQTQTQTALSGSADHAIVAPGRCDLRGDTFVRLRCPEIEDHLRASHGQATHSRRIAQIRLGADPDRLDYHTFQPQEFHPIGKLGRLSMVFERIDGSALYNFNSVNHSLTFVVRYYELPQIPVSAVNYESSLAPGHHPSLGVAPMTADYDSDDDIS